MRSWVTFIIIIFLFLKFLRKECITTMVRFKYFSMDMCSIKASNELFQKVDYDVSVCPLWIFSAMWSSEWGPSLLERPLGPLLSHLVLLVGCRIVPRTVCLFCFYIILLFNFMKIIHGWGTP